MAFQIIAEKINGTRKSVGAAVVARDAGVHRGPRTAPGRRPAPPGSTSTRAPARSASPRTWSGSSRRSRRVTDLPLSHRQRQPQALARRSRPRTKDPARQLHQRRAGRLDGVLPLAAERRQPGHRPGHGRQGHPGQRPRQRMDVIRRLIDGDPRRRHPRRAGLRRPARHDHRHQRRRAPTSPSGPCARCKAEFPEVHLTSGALPTSRSACRSRSLVNRAFLTLVVEAGLDCAILDPLDRELRAALLATELLLGRTATASPTPGVPGRAAAGARHPA